MEILIGVAALIILLILIICIGYVKAPPDTAYMISGFRKPRILIGKAGIRIPFLERLDKLSLKMFSVDVKTTDFVPNAEYINVKVDATVKIRIGQSEEMMSLASKFFLNESEDMIIRRVQDTLEGNMREIVGQMKLEEMVTDRKAFGERVQENAIPDLQKMGLEMISFNVQSFSDQNNVIEDLGIDNISQIKKGAAVAKAQADRDIAIAQAQAAKEANDAMGVSVVGIIVALICNLAFLKAVLGFFLGAIFFAASIVCQAVFVNKAFFSVEDAGLDAAVLSDYKRKVVDLAKKSIGLTVAFIGFTFPLILVDAYMGLGSDSLLIWGAMGASAFLLIYAIALYFLNASLLRKSVYSLSERESAIYLHNHKLKRTCAIVLVVLLAVTGVGHHVATSIWGPYSIMKGTTFEDYDSFIEYMEQDIPADSTYNTGYQESVAIPIPEEQVDPTLYYDQYGNEISEEEAQTSRLKDKNGNVVCEYISRRSYVSLRYTPKDGTILPITVCTEDDLQEARQTAAVRHVLFGAAYCIECLAVMLIYFKKRAK